MKITFKKHTPESGLRKIAEPYSNVDMKINKQVFGLINAPTAYTEDNKWSVAITVKKEITAESPCNFRWVFFGVRHESEEAARTWVQNNIEAIMKKYDIHFMID